MTVKLTIIGLGQIGASFGLALADQREQIATTGHDLSRQVEQAALKLGAVERVEHNLPAAVRAADVVLLALPLDQIRPTLKFIAADLGESVLVLDTAPAKASVAAWVKELLPAGCQYVGLFPALQPAALEGLSIGLAAARADLFRQSAIGLAVPPETDEAAARLAANLVDRLGAQPFFTDPAECDGLAAAAHILPGLFAAALAQTVTDQPGWGDIRRLAGRAFSAGTFPLELAGPSGLAEAAGQNRDNTLRLLEAAIQHLTALRDALAADDRKALAAGLEQIRQTRQHWLDERGSGGQPPAGHMPTSSDFWSRQLGGLGKLSRGGHPPESGE